MAITGIQPSTWVWEPWPPNKKEGREEKKGKSELHWVLGIKIHARSNRVGDKKK